MKNKYLIPLAVLAAVGAFLYAFNLHNALFWDDADWIVNNPAVHTLSWQNVKFIFTHDTLAGIGLHSNYYRPFLFLTFMGNYLIGGAHPVGYHVVSNLLHIANAALVFILLDRYAKKRRVAWIAALLFLVHPLQTEAVTYISGRGDPLSVFLMLSALFAFLKNRRWLSGILMILAILSRETAFLFPLYLTVFLMTFVHREPFWASAKKSLRTALSYLGIAVIYGILRLTILNFQNTLNFYRQANAYTEHVAYRIFTFVHVILVYLRLIVWPAGLHMERDIAVNTSLFQAPVTGAILMLVLIAWLTVREWRKGNRIWFFAWGVFFINLAPTSGIAAPINALIYEHWLYFSLFGFFTLVAWYLDVAIAWCERRGRLMGAGVLAILAAYGVFLSAQTIRRNVLWGNTEAFYQDVLRYEPENVRVLNNLANYYSDQGRSADAEALLWRATNAGDIQAAPYYNLANILRDRKDYAGAVELYKKAIAVDPSFPYAYLNLAAIYAQQGNLTGALDALEHLAALVPDDPVPYYNIALVDRALGRKAAARAAVEAGLARAQPGSDIARALQTLTSQLR